MGLLDSVIEAAKQQYQTTKRGFGLLASNPQQFAQEATTRYFPTKEEEAQFAEAQAAGGDYTQTPYYQKIMNLSQFQGSIKPTGLLNDVTFYHGTNKQIDELNPKKSFGDLNVSWVTPDPKFAGKYAGREGGNIMPLKVKAEKTFDFGKNEDINKLTKKASLINIYDPVKGSVTLDSLIPKAGASYKEAENPYVFNLIKKMGYDSVAVYEDGVRNLGIFNAKKNIKSKFEKE